MKQYYNIIDTLKSYIESNVSVNTVTLGAIKDVDFDKQSVYPLSNIDINNVTYEEHTSTFEIQIFCLDIVDTTKEHQQTLSEPFYGNNNIQDVYNTQLTVVNALQSSLRRGDLFYGDYEIDALDSVVANQVSYQGVNLLAGWEVTLSISIANDEVSACSQSLDGEISLITSVISSFNSINTVYGDSDISLSALTNSTSDIVYSIVGSDNGNSLSGNVISLGSAGSVTIRASVIANDVYSSSFKDITLTVAPYTITVTPNTSTKEYGDVDSSISYSSTPSLFSGDVFLGNIARESGENAGSYAIQQGTLSLSDNYNLVFLSGVTFDISSKVISVVPDSSQSKDEGEVDTVFTYSSSPSLVGSDVFSGSLSRVAGESSGDYEITIGTLDLGSNYNINFTTGVNFSVNSLVTDTLFSLFKTRAEAEGFTVDEHDCITNTTL